MTELEQLVDLATAHMNQYTLDGEKSPWEIQRNETNEVLHKLSANYTNEQMFEIITFARKFELFALNTGIMFGKNEKSRQMQTVLERKDALVRELLVENERLAATVERLTKGD